MASISTDKNGNRTIQFRGCDSLRKTLRLGKMPLKMARTCKLYVEQLIAASITKAPIDTTTAKWVNSLDDPFHLKLARLGLVHARETKQRIQLQQALHEWARSRPDLASGSQTNMQIVMRRFLSHFTGTMFLSELETKPSLIDDWLTSLRQKYAEATVNKTIKMAKSFFVHAQRRQWIQMSPLAQTKSGKMTNPATRRYISKEETKRFMAALPNAEWRVLVALARYAGLRVPSEALLLEWGHIDWERNRIQITSPKTQRYGKGQRIIPLFEDLRPYLLEARNEAEHGSKFVVNICRNGDKNLRTQLSRFAARANLPPIARPFRNMRSSLATDLAESFASHVCNEWLGHTEDVAQAHYRITLEQHFERASGAAHYDVNWMQKTTQHVAALACPSPQEATQPWVDPRVAQCIAVACNFMQCTEMTPRRFELRLRD